MDLPVDEWKSYLLNKWALLPKSVQDEISTAETLSGIFLHSSSLLQPEDEVFLKQLASAYLVEKDCDAPLFYREEGNKTFQKKDYMGAAVLYSKGVSHSRPNTEDISLCYANRSAALFHLDQYEACLEDIVRAGMHGYPERLQPKMMLRKAECLVNLGRLQEARQTVIHLESSLNAKPTLVSSSHQILQRNLHHLKVKIREKENLPETFPKALTRAFEDMALGEENKQISGASLSVSLHTDPLKGRHLVAAKDILPGELLVKEDAFVSVLNPGETPPLHYGLENKWDTRVTNGDLYCHRCLKHTLATVPCGGCSYARYCSQECMQKAWECYHSTECPLGGLLLTLGVFCHVALRITLLARFEDVDRVVRMLCEETGNKDICLPEKKNPVKTLHCTNRGESENSIIGETPIPGCNVHGKYESNYNAVFSLLPHTEKHSPEHKFICAISVSALCKQLRAASLQARTMHLKSSKLEAVTPGLCADLTIWGVAILRHMLQLQCNAQAITSIRHTGSRENVITNSRQVRLATGIFPVVSLLNHSCSPNTSVSFTSTVATIRATQQIRKGQEIVHCYGPHESRMGVAERQKKLSSQYFFDCICPACHTETLRAAAEPKWEAFCCNTCRALMQGNDVLSCNNKSCTESVSRDHLDSRLRDLQQQVYMAQKLLRDGKLEKAVQQLLGCREAAESFLSAEHTVVGEIEDSLAQAYAALGDWQTSATHVRKSVRVVEARHGPSSVEIGHELFKLAQVLFNGLAVPEALNAIWKAEKILLVHCGPESDEVQELREMKSCLLGSSFIPVGPLV
ncbi:SET and MYND domain-containing protein 4 isoform X3 [Cricetulus griseus]|uniref:Protein-lysine N-methyltransferase SMYD4 n=3 Tax=Cricetulus griseus TaxID=10029 RepID=A0A8C2MN05_CRIGR|nr:SET and MYND domain-containing protein 4 isoform X3 [Cricetulus griseus]XP_027282551.1 SET and MYND domain-containing protein 4 isoform X3 [Cricetulus griseus]XP_027282553.1 SET and MYND domain-containing protein 4 isoform X3 [Cricetulus griseus]ERE67968.1 SET and MYND domain-containing protein 4 [Cricetulus griseus]